MSESLADKIDKVLPQTQCGECQYDGCRPYAEAMAAGIDSPNHCPPGGLKTLKRLGELLQIDVTPYEAEVALAHRAPSIAIIHEDHCIGCTKCISACPVDAIIGSAKHMHTVISDECTGCQLCVEPCPVDCISMVATPELIFDPEKARKRYQAKKERSSQNKKSATIPDQQAKLSYIEQALARQKQKRETS